jgi:hypothetical protein
MLVSRDQPRLLGHKHQDATGAWSVADANRGVYSIEEISICYDIA